MYFKFAPILMQTNSRSFKWVTQDSRGSGWPPVSPVTVTTSLHSWTRSHPAWEGSTLCYYKNTV